MTEQTARPSPESMDGMMDVLNVIRGAPPERRPLLAEMAAKLWGYHPVTLRQALEAIPDSPAPKPPPPPLSGITPEELDAATLHPTCIVENYLFADLSLVAAAGGTGKTTTLIYEAACIALGRPVWGLKVWNPGATLFITAEDPRSLFVARLREILDAMGLTAYERSKVLSRVNVWDVSGDLQRLAELDQAGNIRLTGLADAIVEAYRNNPPVSIVFDPSVSFGPGERLVNDSEQAIVTACRRIIRGLGCCVRIVAHTGKANARAGAVDQYASRGGTALPDGCRMVAVLSSVNDGEHGTPPEGFELGPGESGFILVRAKLSYAPPQPKLWIRRRGYAFEHFTESRRPRRQDSDVDAEAVYSFLCGELAEGRKHTNTTLETIIPAKLDIPRARVRAALAILTVSGRIRDDDLPREERKGAKKTYLNPAETGGGIDPAPGQIGRGANPADSIPPPKGNGGMAGLNSRPFHHPAAEDLAGLAELAELRGSDDVEVF